MYVKVNNQNVEKYPYTIGDLRKDFPRISFPRSINEFILAEFNVFPVQQTSKPNFDEMTQNVEEASPTYTNGAWTQTWVVTNKSSEEVAAYLAYKSKQMRAMRNDLLSMSDWTQLDDASVDKAVWATYRQTLRDLPQHADWPNVSMPSAPNANLLGGNTDGN